jgi:hypothetical protein
LEGKRIGGEPNAAYEYNSDEVSFETIEVEGPKRDIH